MSGTTPDLATLALEVRYDSLRDSNRELQTFSERGRAASTNARELAAASREMGGNFSNLNRQLQLQQQALQQLLPQYQNYVNYARELQLATTQLQLEQTKYLTALRDTRPVLDNLGLFNRNLNNAFVEQYQQLQRVAAQLSVTTQSYREAADASQRLTSNLSEQKNIQDQFLLAFGGQGARGAQARQRLEDYVGPLGDMNAAEAMNRFIARLREVRDASQQARDAVAVLGVQSLDTIRTLGQLANTTASAQQLRTMQLQTDFADRGILYRDDLRQLNERAAATTSNWGIADALAQRPLTWLERNLPDAAVTNFGQWLAAPSEGNYSLRAAGVSQDIEYQTNRRIAEFNTWMNRQIGGTPFGGLVSAALNFGPFGMPSIMSMAAMVPGLWDWATGRPGPTSPTPTFSAIQTASLSALAAAGGILGTANPEVAAELSRLRVMETLQSLEQMAPGLWDQSVFLGGIGPNGQATGPSVRGPRGLTGLISDQQQSVRDLVREMLAQPGGDLAGTFFAMQELQAGQTSRQVNDALGGGSQRTIQEMRDLIAAAEQGTQALLQFQARLSDTQAMQQFTGTTGEVISRFRDIAQAAADAARATRFGPQLQAFFGATNAAETQMERTSLARGFGGWRNPLADQEAGLLSELYGALGINDLMNRDPAERAAGRDALLRSYDRRRALLLESFEGSQADRLAQGLEAAQIAAVTQNFGGLAQARFGALQQVMSINPQAFYTGGRLDLDLIRTLATRSEVNDPAMAMRLMELSQGPNWSLLQMLLSNADASVAQGFTLGGASLAQAGIPGLLQAQAAAGGPAAGRALAATSAEINLYIQQASQAYGVPEQVIRAIMMQETRMGTNTVNPETRAWMAQTGRPESESPYGVGVMQIIPSTWRGLTGGAPLEGRLDPRQSIFMGARLLQQNAITRNADGSIGAPDWNQAIRRYGPQSDPNGYLASVARWLEPGNAAAVAQATANAQATGAASFAADTDQGLLAAMRQRIAQGNLVGSFDTTMGALRQGMSQGLDTSAIAALEQSAARSAEAMARLNIERSIFNDTTQLQGFEQFIQVMRETGGNIDIARLAMERFNAARQFGGSRDDPDLIRAQNARSLAGLGRLAYDEAMRTRGLTDNRDLAALELSLGGMGDRDRQMILALGQEDIRFRNRVSELQAGLNRDDPASVSRFDADLATANEIYQTNRDIIGQTGAMRGQIEEARRAQELMLEPLRNMFRNLQSEAANVWRVLLDGGSVAGKTLEQQLSNIFKNAAAQLLGTLTTNMTIGPLMGLFGAGSFGQALGIPMSGGFGGGFGGGGLLSLGGVAASFVGGGSTGGMPTIGGVAGRAYSPMGAASPTVPGRGSYIGGMGLLGQVAPLIGQATGIPSLGAFGALNNINELMSLNTGGQGFFSWGGLTNAGNDLFSRSTFLDRTFPGLFANASIANTSGSLGSFGSLAGNTGGVAGMGGLGPIADIYGITDLGNAAASAGSQIGSQAGSAGALGMTGAQALAGVGAIAGVANFAMNPNIGSGLSAAGGIMTALASFGVIGSAFGPIGMALAALGAVVSMSMSSGKKGYAGATGRLTVDAAGNLVTDQFGGKGVDVRGFTEGYQGLAENINRLNAELNLKISQGFGEQFVAVGDGNRDLGDRKRFDSNNPYLSIASSGLLYREGDDFLNSILRDERSGFSINRSSVDTFARAIKFYDNYYKEAIKTSNPVSSQVQQQRDLRQSFYEGIRQANWLGFDQGMIRAGYAGRFNEDATRGVRRLTDPMGLALEDFDQLAAERLETARALGADINMIEKLNGEERKRIIEQYMGGITNIFKSALKALTQGQVAGETDLSRYNASLVAYGSLLTKYPTASEEGKADYVQQALDLVANARSLFSDTPEFAAVYQKVLGDLLKFAPEGSDEGNAARQALDRLVAGYGNPTAILPGTLPNAPNVNPGTAVPPTTPSLADLVAGSPIGKDVAAGLAPGLSALGELITVTNNILRELLLEQRSTNNYIKSIMQNAT